MTLKRFRRTTTGLMLAVLLVALSTPSPANGAEIESFAPPTRQAAYTVFPNSVFYNAAAKAKWWETLKTSKYALTNGYEVFRDQELEELHAAGTELFVYRWFNGYYAAELGVWNWPHITPMYQEIHQHPDWLINPFTPMMGGGATTPAYFFDWAHPEMRAFYISKLVGRLAEINYDGVFFDYIGDWALPPTVQPLWAAKHPEMTYNEAGALFLAELRAAMPDKRISGNQAYRLDNAKDYYRSVDFDVTESFGTSWLYGKQSNVYVEGKGVTPVIETYFRPWDGLGGYRQLMEELPPAPVPAVSGSSADFYLTNYMNPRYVATGQTSPEGHPVYRGVVDRPAIHYGFALGLMHNYSSFNSDWASWEGNPEFFEHDNVYGLDLGNPITDSYVITPTAVIRYFERGAAVVTLNNQHNNQATPNNLPTGSPDPVPVTLDPTYIPQGTTALWNSYAEQVEQGWTPGAAVEVAPDAYPSGSYYPSGRIYMYVPAATDGGTEPTTAPVRGVVSERRAPAGPIAGAQVECGPAAALTDATGSYELRVTPGTYTCTASASGYRSQKQRVAVSSSGATASFELKRT